MSAVRFRNLADAWCSSVAKFPRKTAAIYGDRSWSYEALDRQVRSLASHLREDFGVGAGDRVAVAAPNCIEFLVGYWSAVRLGATLVPVNIRMKKEGVGFILEETDPKVLFLHDHVPPAVKEAARDAVGPGRCIGIETEADVAARFGDLTEDDRDPEFPEISPEDLAVIAYTSGTTGRPKGPMLSHADLLFNIRNTIIPHLFCHDDIHMLVVPLFHCTGLNSIITTSAYTGATVVLAPRPDVKELVGLIQRHRITTFLGVPTLFHFLVTMKNLDSYDLGSLRLIAYSGSPMPPSTISALSEKLPGVALHNFFGLTETISITNVLTTPDANRIPESVGKPLPEIGMKIIGEDGKTLGADEVGELCFHRDNVVQGYYRRPGLLEESCDGDWFRTGDLARVDSDGYLFLKGRRKDMIIVGGENVYALEVENCLVAHDDVLEAAVVGVPATGIRAHLGELVKAVIVPKPDREPSERDLKRHCMERLESYKVPQIIRFVEALPRTPSGKVRKAELRGSSA